eukprot:13170126-Alexandrium_andersonii.AAC.1
MAKSGQASQSKLRPSWPSPNQAQPLRAALQARARGKAKPAHLKPSRTRPAQARPAQARPAQMLLSKRG